MFKKSAELVLKKCLNVKKNEKVLVIADLKSWQIAKEFYRSAKNIAEAKIIKIKIPETNGAEPEKRVAEEMLSHDVILMPTTKSLSHTQARKRATTKGARIASMPGIRERMAVALDVDYSSINKLNKKLIKILQKTKKIRVMTAKGTDISFSFKGRKWENDDGILAKKGAFGNLPAGEVSAAPIEGETNGKFICDASIGGLGRVDNDISFTVLMGFANNITGGKTAQNFKKSLKDKDYRNIAEFGIGTNYRAKISGNVLEDEKAIGTAHIALGNNLSYGGKVGVPFHSDCVIKKPTIFCDGKIIMQNGRLTI